MRICLECGTESTEIERSDCTDCGGPVAKVVQKGASLAGRKLGERYVLLQRLGQGGFGSVYKARHRHLDQFVAIKVLNSDVAAHPDMLKRFYGEAKNTSKLRHPHNVRVFDFGHTDDGLVYIVMELVYGMPLGDLPKPMAPRRVLRILDQVCGALAEAHSLGLIHRDMKPDNVMVTEVDGEDYVHVLDYGIAKLEDSSTRLTRGGFIGTPQYAAPEQATGATPDRRSDIYALGLISYELVTGRRTFEAVDPIPLMLAHRDQQPEPPSAFCRVSPALEALVLDCLEKSPEDRPASTDAIRERIRELPEWRGEHTGPVDTTTMTPPLGPGHPSRTEPGGGGTAGRVAAPVATPEGNEWGAASTTLVSGDAPAVASRSEARPRRDESVESMDALARPFATRTRQVIFVVSVALVAAAFGLAALLGPGADDGGKGARGAVDVASAARGESDTDAAVATPTSPEAVAALPVAAEGSGSVGESPDALGVGAGSGDGLMAAPGESDDVPEVAPGSAAAIDERDMQEEVAARDRSDDDGADEGDGADEDNRSTRRDRRDDDDDDDEDHDARHEDRDDDGDDQDERDGAPVDDDEGVPSSAEIEALLRNR